MMRVREVIVVEGRYDKNAVLQAVSATVVETAGFGVFSDGEKIALLRLLAMERGIIILTDSDSAGFLIRNHLKGMLPQEGVKHAYIPDIPGREKRKSAPSKEGKLGVEGMRPDVILSALQRAGATFEDVYTCRPESGGITKADLYSAGLSGGACSAQKRRDLAARLGLPENMTANALLDVLNILYSREEFFSLVR